MSRLPWSKFQWKSWETDPALASCSMAAQGFWMRLLCMCAEADGYLLIGGKKPTPEALAHLSRQSVSDVQMWLDELARNGVFSRTRGGVIFSRRMRDDREKHERSREFGQRGGNPALVNKGKSRKGVNPPVKLEKEKEKEEDPPNPQGGSPDLFQGEAEPPKADDFEAAWKAYPHTKGRSSKADSRKAWASLPDPIKAALPAAVARYAAEGREPKMECGAPAMERWLRKGRYADWMTPEPSAPVLDRADLWRRRIEAYLNGSKYWNTNDWGSRPGQTGCGAPAAVLAEFGMGGSAAVLPFPPSEGRAA